MYIRKFYSPEEGWQGATASTVKIVATNVPGLHVSAPAEPTETVEPPATPEIPQPPAIEPPAPVTPAVTPVVEPPAPTQVPVVNPEPATPPAAATLTPQQIKDWKKDLKEQGFDDEFIKMADFRLKTGTIKPYLEAVSVDYKGMTSEQILKRDLQEKYPTLTPAQIDRKFLKDTNEKYMQDVGRFEAEDVDLGKAEMDADANSLRTKFLERQNQFTIPDKDLSVEQKFQQEEQARQMEQETQMYRNSILNNPITKTLQTEKKIVFDLGEGATFNYAVPDPQGNLDTIIDPVKGRDAVSSKDVAGNRIPDARKLVLASIIFKGDADKFVREIYKQGLSDGQKKFVEKDLENIQVNGNPTPVLQGLTIAEAWKQNGKRVGF